jgi:hypothetical protein
MHFDHIPEKGRKLFHLSKACASQHTEQQVLAEMRKCELVCANCHAIRTHNRSVKARSQRQWTWADSMVQERPQMTAYGQTLQPWYDGDQTGVEALRGVLSLA